MNKSGQINPESKPRHYNVDALLEQLPSAYEAWEKGTADPELTRIQRRVIELMRDAEKK